MNYIYNPILFLITSYTGLVPAERHIIKVIKC